MAKKERNFHGEADFLRHQLRELAAETGTVIKDTNFMKKEECKEEIVALNRVKYRKEVEAETRANIENLKKELADRNNQITTLEKKKTILENEKKNCMEIILEKDKRMDTQLENIEKLETEIKALEIAKQGVEKELQESNQAKEKTIAANVEKLEELEKEIKEKNAEIRASQLTLEKREKKIEEYKNHNIKLAEKIVISLAAIKELKNRKWYQFWK